MSATPSTPMSLQYTPSSTPHLRNRIILITGASRGIGRTIALRAALDGASVAILAKTATPHPSLPGTIHTVAEEVRALGGKALALQCDIRDERQVEEAIKRTVEEFGGIDVVVNNASAISLTGCEQTSMKKYDLMHDINVRGTFLVSKAALPHLLKSSNPHILSMSPPMSLKEEWFASHPAYTMSKYGMSMVTMGLAAEYKGRIAVNSLWPRTVISTSALQAFAGDQLDELHRKSRTAAIIADAAGVFAIDDVVLKAQKVRDLSLYACVPGEADFGIDLFVEEKEYTVPPMKVVLSGGVKSKL